MSDIKLGCHVGMAGKDMFLASAREAAPYIIKLANTVKPETYELAVKFPEKEIVRTAAMKSQILVLHPGSHANVYKGSIGYETLHRLVYDERFANVPKILETPWLCEEGSTKKTMPPYKEEIAWLRQE